MYVFVCASVCLPLPVHCVGHAEGGLLVQRVSCQNLSLDLRSNETSQKQTEKTREHIHSQNVLNVSLLHSNVHLKVKAV